MPRFKSILCPIDFSAFSVKAYDYAQSLAWHYKAELLVQHVRYSFPAFYIDASYKEIRRKLRTDALQKLREFVKRQTRTKLQPQCVVHEGCRLFRKLTLFGQDPLFRQSAGGESDRDGNSRLGRG